MIPVKAVPAKSRSSARYSVHNSNNTHRIFSFVTVFCLTIICANQSSAQTYSPGRPATSNANQSTAGSSKQNSQYFDALYKHAVNKMAAEHAQRNQRGSTSAVRQNTRFQPARRSQPIRKVSNTVPMGDPFHQGIGRNTGPSTNNQSYPAGGYHGQHVPPGVGQRVLKGKDGKPIHLPMACTTGIPDSFFQDSPNGQQTGRRQERTSARSSGRNSAQRFEDNLRYPAGSGNPRVVSHLPNDARDIKGRQRYRDNLRQLVRGEDLYGKQNLRSYEATGNRSRSLSNSHSSPFSQADYQQGSRRSSNVRQSGYNTGSYNPHANATAKNRGIKRNAKKTDPNAPDPHADVFAGDLFPSATKCAKCHQQVFDEWASSSHAYASLSPMFTRFEDTINKLAQGTIGYFCMRCHTPVGTTLGLRRDQPIWDAPRAVREGVTCVVCHHVSEITLKTNGERRVEPGTINDPVAGNSDGLGVEAALANAGSLKVKIDPNDKRPGQQIHRRAYKFEELSKSTFCIACHQVAVQPGIKLEVVAEQYRASPARRQGITCQDCHMGKVPGAAEGYSVGPAAVVDGKVVNPLRQHSNHMFYGPGYSIAHPGIFPHDPEQDRWTFNQWLEFDWRAGWGTKRFENDLADGKIYSDFPSTWANADDRYDARDIVDRNLKKLEYKRQVRRQVLENGSHIDGPFFTKPKGVGEPLEFNYCVSNKSPGHNMPSGSLGAQPQLWLNVVLIDPDGQRIWESGYLDSNGDLCDLHSLDVLARKYPLDKQLCNFQTKFLTTNVKGTDREMYLPVNFDFDQLPFIRPAAQPVTLINHPPFIRMEGHSIPALGSRKAKYRIPGRLLRKRGVYRLSVRLRSRAEPIYFMKFVKSTPEMIKSMNEWIVDVHPYSYTFEVR